MNCLTRPLRSRPRWGIEHIVGGRILPGKTSLATWFFCREARVHLPRQDRSHQDRFVLENPHPGERLRVLPGSPAIRGARVAHANQTLHRPLLVALPTWPYVLAKRRARGKRAREPGSACSIIRALRECVEAAAFPQLHRLARLPSRRVSSNGLLLELLRSAPSRLLQTRGKPPGPMSARASATCRSARAAAEKSSDSSANTPDRSVARPHGSNLSPQELGKACPRPFRHRRPPQKSPFNELRRAGLPRRGCAAPATRFRLSLFFRPPIAIPSAPSARAAKPERRDAPARNRPRLSSKTARATVFVLLASRCIEVSPDRSRDVFPCFSPGLPADLRTVRWSARVSLPKCRAPRAVLQFCQAPWASPPLGPWLQE